MPLFSNKERSAGNARDRKVASSAKPATKATDTRSKKRGVLRVENLTKGPGRILKSQRITEKAAYMTLIGAYVFDVAQDATKQDVATVIKALYNVTPRKVNIVRSEPRPFVARMRSRRGILPGRKKAYVFLKKGDKIDLA